MIFISDAQGTITAVVPSPIQQGSNDANEVILLTPLCGAVKLLCTLPNGIKTTPIYMEPLYEFDYKNDEGKNLLAFRCTLPYAVTQYPGSLKLQFVVVVNVTEVNEQGNIVNKVVTLEDGTEIPVTRSFKTSTTSVSINDGVPYIDDGNTAFDAALSAANAAAQKFISHLEDFSAHCYLGYCSVINGLIASVDCPAYLPANDKPQDGDRVSVMFQPDPEIGGLREQPKKLDVNQSGAYAISFLDDSPDFELKGDIPYTFTFYNNVWNLEPNFVISPITQKEIEEIWNDEE